MSKVEYSGVRAKPQVVQDFEEDPVYITKFVILERDDFTLNPNEVSLVL